MWKRIEDYGVVGNGKTCALINADSSVDWLCLPYFDSPSFFSSILDPSAGSFSIAPQDYSSSSLSYIEKTNILENLFQSPEGELLITNFMPRGRDLLLRRVKCRRGRVDIKLRCYPRFNYGKENPSVQFRDGSFVFSSGGETLYLRVLHEPRNVKMDASGVELSLGLRNGESFWVVFSYGDMPELNHYGCEELLSEEIDFWNGWVHRCEPGGCVFAGPWHDLAVRSGLTLKLLSTDEGAVVASPTTSLPESIGGERNWDYRYVWIRDSAFTFQALMSLGHRKEAYSYFDWLRRLCRSCEEHMPIEEFRIAFTIRGELVPEERELRHLRGYMDSRPVRVGNKAGEQFQLDVYGELVETFYLAWKMGIELSEADLMLLENVANFLTSAWRLPDSGIWEFRGKTKHYTHSKLMSWLALKRVSEVLKDSPRRERWLKAMGEVESFILENCFSQRLNSFVQHPGSGAVDISLLLIPVLGFLSGEDPRVLGTLERVKKELGVGKGLYIRYNADDGLRGEDNPFLLGSFWMVEALVHTGQLEKAEEILVELLGLVNPLGLLPEEISRDGSMYLGNYPLALSHVGLINSALAIGLKRNLVS